MDKRKDIVSSKVVGCDVGCVEGFSAWVAVSLVVLFGRRLCH